MDQPTKKQDILIGVVGAAVALALGAVVVMTDAAPYGGRDPAPTAVPSPQR